MTSLHLEGKTLDTSDRDTVSWHERDGSSSSHHVKLCAGTRYGCKALAQLAEAYPGATRFVWRLPDPFPEN
jgi:hypothetical protein